MTMPLDLGIVLPGITRKSVIEMTKEWDEFKVTEEIFSMNDIIKALKQGRVSL